MPKNIEEFGRESIPVPKNGSILEMDPQAQTDPRHLVDLFELVLNNVYSGIIVTDRQGRVVFMNQVYAELLNVDRHEVVGSPIQRFFPSSRLSQVMASGQAELGQRCSLRTNTPLLVNRIPLKHKGRTTGAILQTVFRDYQHFTDLLARLNLLENEVKYYKKGLTSVLSARYTFNAIIGQSKAMADVKRLTVKYAQADAPVLFIGPTGTGKELFCHAVHSESPRSGGPFVCVNCAAIPRELLESELFGYESGAFTGASKKGKPGQIELAHQGTLYLDEIGDLPISAQAKLLRVLDTKMLDKVGGVKSVHVDFRLVAATNRDLPNMMTRRLFRDDLYYRLNTMTVNVPPLVERNGDIPVLVNHFLENLERPELKLDEPAMEALQKYEWPGNVRELKNVVERAVSLTEGDIIGRDQLPREILDCGTSNAVVSGQPDTLLADELAGFEKHLIRSRLETLQGNMSKTAKSLGVSRSTLYEKCQKHQLI
jgi:transcriptional regulator with PAS, ATPase and Fis domain